jgi:membrane protein implicated in regulation of membrane protease activity
VSIAALVFLRPFASRVGGQTRNPGGIDRIAGKQAIVLKEIDPLHGTGMVRIDREEWRAESVDHTMIPKDVLVDVVSVTGTRVLVKRRNDPVTQ